MIVTIDNNVTLRAGNDAEASILSEFFTDIPSDTVLKYKGRGDDTTRPPGEFFTVILGYEDKQVILSGTSDEDAAKVNQIRNMCYIGNANPTLLNQETDDKGVAVTLSLSVKCKHCDSDIYDSMHRAEWKTCQKCVNTCEHTWIEGAVHIPGLGFGVGKFCSKCGTGKPKEPGEPEKTMAEHHKDLVEKGFVDAVIYK